ncbi:glycoside hydrolase family protein [Streptomyces sp. NPDC101062]|uniref:glycoside hydrolase family protein n=1 Tax=unclassified Streptomyces TaxID=2593676 RepID=UPI002E79EFC1|nr:glycoside hydrolase family protein [Streptomyces sp. JV176]MEE1799062.1 glycoside hydrolase family protein [Streptomyces sp. JV176]
MTEPLSVSPLPPPSSRRRASSARRPFLVLASLLALLVTAFFSPAANAEVAASSRKGVSVNTVTGTSQALADVGAAWYYNWASSTAGVTKPAGTEFVPMIWGAGSVTDAQLSQAKAQGTQLLGFNEPDMAGQANMSVEQALNLWPRLQSTGMRLGAPAVAFGGNTPGGWLDRFMSGAAARGYRVDFIPLHWYGGDFSSAAAEQLRGYLQAVYDRYHKPIWLTEYALIDFSGSAPRYPSSQQQADFVRSSTAMLESQSYVERYSWFTLSTQVSPTGLYNGTTPNASGLVYRAVGR